MRLRPPRSTRTDTLFPYNTLFRSGALTTFDMEGDGWPRFRALPSQATDFRQEKRESGVTRLPLFELCSRARGKDRSGSSLDGRPWKIVLYSAASAMASTDTYLRPSLPSWNRTWPSAVAKSVWSLPMPTLTPG